MYRLGHEVEVVEEEVEVVAMVVVRLSWTLCHQWMSGRLPVNISSQLLLLMLVVTSLSLRSVHIAVDTRTVGNDFASNTICCVIRPRCMVDCQ